MPNLREKLGPDEIRILTLQNGQPHERIICTMTNMPLEQAVDIGYTALSYTWGPEDQPRHSIEINGSNEDVRERLYQALKHLRDPHQPRELWVDALCIDQDNNEEKTVQLPLMGRIYSDAKVVDIWLGIATNGEGHDEDEEWAMYAISNGDTPAQQTERFIRATTKILRRQWFQRLWIVQELALGAPGAVRIRLGDAVASWDNFRGILQLSKDLMKQEERVLKMLRSPHEASNMSALRSLVQTRGLAGGSSSSRTTSTSVTDLIDRMTAVGDLMNAVQDVSHIITIRDNLKKDNQPLQLHPVLMSARCQRAGNLRDKIYGLLGMVDDAARDALQPNYQKSKLTVYRDATVYLLTAAARGAQMLYHWLPISPRPDKNDGDVEPGPSWVLDFSYTRDAFIESCFSSPDELRHIATPPARLLPSDEGVMLVEATVVDTIAGLCTFHVATADLSATEHSAAAVASLVRDVLTLYGKARDRALKASWAPANPEPLLQTLLGPLFFQQTVEDIGSEAELDHQLNVVAGIRGPLSTLQLLEKAPPLIDSINTLAGEEYDEKIRTFFVTRHGVCGMCVGQPRVGDVAAVLFRGSSPEVHFVLRPSKHATKTTGPTVTQRESGKFRMVGVARISDDWLKYCRAHEKLKAETIRIL